MKTILVLIAGVLGISQATEACGSFVMHSLMSRCGQAFEGQVVRDTENSDAWGKARIVMHIRDCSDEQIKIPLHVGDNRSRVWVLTAKGDGNVELKHDHRHADGHPDAVTMYGGTTERVDAARHAFPVDEESIALFEANGLEASVTNTWEMAVDGDRFTYRLTRPSGRDFIIAFDLTKPVPAPPAAWDLVGHQP